MTDKSPRDIVGENERVLSVLAKHKCVGRIVSIDHVEDLRKNIQDLARRRVVDEEFYQERLMFFDFNVPKDANSVIIVAVPRPQSQAIFNLDGKRTALIIPPTYVAYERTMSSIKQIISSQLTKKSYSVTRAFLPLKLLAAQSGLCRYGRNNICYVPRMGSFFQLAAYYSSIKTRTDLWEEPKMMPNCENCNACRLNCPTGAISNDRFLLHTENCLVFHNEKKGNIPFAKKINPSWHNCLIGCMRCQNICPLNKKFESWIMEKEEFSEEETQKIIGAVPRDQLLPATRRKLRNLSLWDDADVLPRNLGVLLKEG